MLIWLNSVMTAPMDEWRHLPALGVPIDIPLPGRRFAKQICREGAEQTAGRGTYVPLVFQPGEAFQFDWSEDWANIGGERVKLQVAHIKLSHSRAFLVRAYPIQRPGQLCEPPRQPARLPRAADRGGGRQNRLRARPHHRKIPSKTWQGHL